MSKHYSDKTKTSILQRFIHIFNCD